MRNIPDKFVGKITKHVFKFYFIQHQQTGFYNRGGVFTARYGLSAYITQIRVVRKGTILTDQYHLYSVQI